MCSNEAGEWNGPADEAPAPADVAGSQSASAGASATLSEVPRADRLILIVVGSSVAAEVTDRPVAQRLQASIAARLADDEGLHALVCTDLWYLNDRELAGRPVIAIGEPSRNAATAMLCARLPTAMVIDQSFRVHLDPEFIEPQAAIWGSSVPATEAGVSLFVERYLNDFLAAAE